MQLIRLNETTAGLIEVQFTSVFFTNLQTRMASTDIANSSITVYSKRGGTASAVLLSGGTFTATDDTHAIGVRGYRPAAADLVAGVQTLIFTGTNMETREVPIMVVYDDPYRPVYYGAVVAGTLTTSAFTSNRTETTVNAFADALIEWLTGPNAGTVLPLPTTGGYDGAGKFTYSSTYVTPAAPTIGDTFRIVTR